MRYKFSLILVLFFTIAFCKGEKQSLEQSIISRFEKVDYGKSKLSFSEFANIGGYQKIEEEEIERKSVGFDIIKKHYGNDYIKFQVNFAGIDASYKDDILPFVEISVRCGEGERFFGFGEWADYADATGLKREIWTQEQHFGTGDDNNPPRPFGEVSTYFPVPFFISSQNYAFFVSGYSRMEFYMCDSQNFWKVKVFSDNFEFFIFFWNKKPFEAIEKFTALVGRQRTPKIWAFGNWLDQVLGQEYVLNTAKWARENKIPASAIWTEDWAGGTWRTQDIYSIAGWDKQEDKKLYPNIKELSENLKELGFKFLGYFHTFVPVERTVYQDALSIGILMKDKNGSVRYYLHPAEGKTTLIDFSNPKALNFIYENFERAAKLGFSGWMADFGEWVTPDIFTYDGKSGWEIHNMYPYIWAKLNREFWESYKPDGDFVFFSRSGFTGSWKYSPVVWQGDQNTTFERFDGLGSIIPMMTSIGIAGVSNVGPDIAGYTTLGIPSDKELYLRWVSICAFVPVFRTHHGTTPLLNWRFDKDSETTEIFRFYATEHMKLVPYIYKLSKLAEEKGYPAVRHIFLEYPKVVRYLPEKLETIEQQFLLGDSILVAGIVEKGKSSREVYIPPGKWVDYFSPSSKYDGGDDGRFLEVNIPLGKIFVLVKEGSCIEVFDPVPHTLLSVSDDVKKRYEIIDINGTTIKQKCF